MDTLTKKRAAMGRGNSHNRAHVAEAASELLNEGRKLAHEIYEDSLHKAGDVQDNAKEYSDELLNKVKENPLASVLIAGGIGFLLSILFKK